MPDRGGDDRDWWLRFAELDAVPSDSSPGARQRRGIEFESVLAGMLSSARMEPRTRFRPTGEEIDGSFFHRGRVMLLEAKWTAKPLPASALYAFRGKIDGKLVGTIGLFISMAGFSEDAVDALIAGKGPVALWDWRTC